jgi:hypothetical protein
MLLTLFLLASGLRLPAQPDRDRERPGPRKGRPEAVERYFEQLRERDPEELERLQDLRKRDPEAFRRELREKVVKGPHGGRKPSDPRRKFFEEQVNRISSASTPEEREAAIARLKQEVTERMDRAFTLREEAIERMRSQLTALEARHEQQLEKREEIIHQQVRRILQAADEGNVPETGE